MIAQPFARPPSPRQIRADVPLLEQQLEADGHHLH
jgi:hypothetical protein